MARHHLVPQMLLRRFATTEGAHGQLVMAARDSPHPVRRVSVRTACAEADFYNIATEDLEPQAREDHDPELVEKTLAGIETNAAPVLDAFCAGRLPSREKDRYRFAFFAAMQMCRGWRFREDVQAFATASARLHLEANMNDQRIGAWLREQGKAYDNRSIARFRQEVLTADWRVVWSQPAAVQEALRHALFIVLPVLYERPWKLLRFEDPVLLTSDAPIAPWSPPRPPGAPPPALMTAKELYFPLDRRTCLSFASSGPNLVIPIRAQRAPRINTVVAAQGHRWIFHHPDDHPLDGLSVPRPTKVVEEILRVNSEHDGTVRATGQLVQRPG